MEDVVRIVISIATLVFSVIFHEMAHAWSALMMGDPTGKNDNRLSWNPIRHIDPIMTIIVPVVLYVSSSGTFIFGGAKPVRVNPLNFQNPGRGMMLSAAAGPGSNYLLALVGFGLLYLLVAVAPGTIVVDSPGGLTATIGGFFFFNMVFINLFLGTFNLIPIPPLDGSRILRYLLPPGGKQLIDSIEPYGLFLLVILMFAGLLKYVILSMYVVFIGVIYGALDTEIVDALFRAMWER
jgi:Zn-dependent protease